MKIKMKIQIGNYKLIHSETVITLKNTPTIITLPDEIEGDFKFIINFITDSKIIDTKLEQTGIDDFTLQMNFINFNSLIAGSSNLIRLGTLQNKPLYFNYRVFNLNNTGHTLIFNFYINPNGN